MLSKYSAYSVEQAYTFKQANFLLQEKHYDFVILDLNLPDADGEELVIEIKKITEAKIIILTSEVDIQIRETLFKKGILDYLVKESDFSSIVKMIHFSIEATEKNRSDTVLVIDDSKFMCKQLESILKIRNYNVEIAWSTEAGLASLQSKNINTIVLDMELPDKHGLEFLRELKDIDEYCHIPVIIISGTNDPEVVRSALKTGASDFIKKPFNIEEFILKVDLSVETNRKYVEAMCAQKMLSEYKDAVDEASFVSKTDTRGIITYANDLFCKLSGYTKEELIGAPHNIVRHPDMPADVFKEIWQTIKAKKIWKGMVKNRKKNGEAYYVKSTIKPILDVNGEIIEYIAIRTDVTELEVYKEILEEDLSISNYNLQYMKQYEDAMDTFVSVIKTNRSGIITYVNDNFCTLSAYDKNELLGQSCDMLRVQKHLDAGDCDVIAKQLDNKESISILFENLSKDNKTYFVDTKIFPLTDIDGKIVEHLHLMYDVTEIIEIHQELENTQKEIIYKMGEIGESRSQETGNHVKRVAEYSKLLALLAGLSEEEANLLFTASPMHDIGKVGIPDAILKKPEKLTAQEFEIMKSHSSIGYDILKSSKKATLRAAAIIAYTHHEKWDGSGYPKGLKGEDIHIYGRITAIADVFDALGSERIYKKAWNLDKIISFFKEERGKHFDPKLLDLFLENLDQFVAIRDKFKEDTLL